MDVLGTSPLMGDGREMEAHAQTNHLVSSSPLATHQRTDDDPTEESPAHHHHQHQQQQQSHQQGGSEARKLSSLPVTKDPEDNIASPSNRPSESPLLAEPCCPRTPTRRVASPTRHPKDRIHTAHNICQAGEKQDAPAAADDNSTSTPESGGSSSGSSASGSDSCYDEDSDEAAAGILEDFTEGVDSWLEDVHGAGREAFFGLFKRDATPQFCRPSLEIIGRHVSATSSLGETVGRYLALSTTQTVGASRSLATSFVLSQRASVLWLRLYSSQVCLGSDHPLMSLSPSKWTRIPYSKYAHLRCKVSTKVVCRSAAS